MKPLEECGYDRNWMSPSMLCAGGGLKDSCTADSGGPLVCEQNGKAVVKGLTSWGAECGHEKRLGVYTNVFLFKDFIKAILVKQIS